MKLKSLLHYLNRRDHRLLPQKNIITKIIFTFTICLTIIFSVKTILAITTGDTKVNDETGREETLYTEIPVSYNTETQQQIAEKQESLEDGNINSENWTKESAITNGLLVVNTLAGTDTVAMISGDPSWVAGGFIGATNQVIASLYNPPASGVQYIAYSLNSFMGKSAYAANDGFNQLKGIQPIWKICRNTVYTIISLVFVVMGILIMLRIKISPQATITIQNSIPKIITTLILVTFSYAICGLIIDFTYLIQALILSLLVKTDATDTFTKSLSLENLIKGSLGTYSSLAWNVLWSSSNTTTIVFSALSGIVAGIVGLLTFTSWWGGLLCLILGAAIVLIFVFIQIIKFFFGCAKAYIILLIKLVTAPLEIALGSFPNSKIGFSSWFIQTIAYASIFPICLIFLVFLTLVLNTVSMRQVWTPGVLQGSGITAAIKPILGIAGLIILSKLPNLIPEAIFKIKPSPFGKAINEGFTHNALVNRVRGGINFTTEQRIGSTFYGLKGNAVGFKEKMKNKRDAKASDKAHQDIDQNANTNSTPPLNQTPKSTG